MAVEIKINNLGNILRVEIEGSWDLIDTPTTVYKKIKDLLIENAVRGIITINNITEAVSKSDTLIITEIFYEIEKDKYFVYIPGVFPSNKSVENFTVMRKLGDLDTSRHRIYYDEEEGLTWLQERIAGS